MFKPSPESAFDHSFCPASELLAQHFCWHLLKQVWVPSWAAF